MSADDFYSAFCGDCLVAAGDLETLLRGMKPRVDAGEQILVFVDQTGRQIDFDFRGTIEQVIARAKPEKKAAGPGRPKLGVVSREVTLLPRHWEWLERQSSGASGTLRRLVETAIRDAPSKAHARRARDAANGFMTAMCGDRPHYEEATRALYAKDQRRFDTLIRGWPPDIRKHLERLVGEATRLEG